MASMYLIRHNTWLEKQNFKEKECRVCKTPFKPKSGIHKYCSHTCKGKMQYINGRSSTKNQYTSISGNWKRYFQRLCCRSHKRIDLSWEDCFDILKKQEYKCALSGVELTCKLEKGVKFLTNASIDRIEAGGPYIKDNIQLVCAVLNGFRKDTDVNEFIWWCKKVSEWND